VKEQFPKTDIREYTIVLVSHQGQAVKSIKIPWRYVKYTLAGIAGAILLVLGTLLDFHFTAVNVALDKAKYEQSQQINGTQNQELQKLAQQTAELQENMNRLNALDVDMRRMINTEKVQ
jgi:stress response protein YsnF